MSATAALHGEREPVERGRGVGDGRCLGGAWVAACAGTANPVTASAPTRAPAPQSRWAAPRELFRKLLILNHCLSMRYGISGGGRVCCGRARAQQAHPGSGRVHPTGTREGNCSDPASVTGARRGTGERGPARPCSRQGRINRAFRCRGLSTRRRWRHGSR